MIDKLKDKVIRFCRWIWQECKDIKTLLLFLLVIAVVYSPVWGGYLLYGIFGWKWASVVASACLVFWAGPFTPFFPICIGITLSVKRWAEKHAERRAASNVPKPERTITYTKLFWLFLAGSVAGVIIEGTFSLLTKGHWETHVVSVLAPYNILYGFGAVLFYVGAVGLKRKPLAIRVVTMTALATALELLCGLLLRYGLGMRAWNYTNYFMNYKGIICLGFSCMWGIAALAFSKLSPFMEGILKRFAGRPWQVAGAVLSLAIVLDMGMTGASILRWSERHYGIPAQSRIQKELDIEAPDDWMQKRFMEWRFLDTETAKVTD